MGAGSSLSRHPPTGSHVLVNCTFESRVGNILASWASCHSCEHVAQFKSCFYPTLAPNSQCPTTQQLLCRRRGLASRSLAPLSRPLRNIEQSLLFVVWPLNNMIQGLGFDIKFGLPRSIQLEVLRAGQCRVTTRASVQNRFEADWIASQQSRERTSLGVMQQQHTSRTRCYHSRWHARVAMVDIRFVRWSCIKGQFFLFPCNASL